MNARRKIQGCGDQKAPAARNSAGLAIEPGARQGNGESQAAADLNLPDRTGLAASLGEEVSWDLAHTCTPLGSV